MSRNDLYIFILSQLAINRMAYTEVDGCQVVVEPLGTTWKLSTKIFSKEGPVPEAVVECVWAVGMLKWKERVQLVIDSISGEVHLIQEIPIPCGDVFFDHQLLQFIELSKEWKEIISEFSCCASMGK